MVAPLPAGRCAIPRWSRWQGGGSVVFKRGAGGGAGDFQVQDAGGVRDGGALAGHSLELAQLGRADGGGYAASLVGSDARVKPECQRWKSPASWAIEDPGADLEEQVGAAAGQEQCGLDFGVPPRGPLVQPVEDRLAELGVDGDLADLAAAVSISYWRTGRLIRSARRICGSSSTTRTRVTVPPGWPVGCRRPGRPSESGRHVPGAPAPPRPGRARAPAPRSAATPPWSGHRRGCPPRSVSRPWPR